ncbi:MAG: DNA polymerase III subunit delta' [Hydrogenophilales bacterium]|nr:DNA polymerase III subunit delta' [Hydrogenophilales bacterium]
MGVIHPWNLPLFRQLTVDRERMPHALLLRGPAGVGKRDLAMGLAQWALCEAPTANGACGVCDACNWFLQGNHPDFRQVEPQEEEVDDSGKVTKKASKQISVESVRGITDFLGLTAHRGGWRAAVVHPAEYMNAAAANALLKTLEEPPPRVLLILVSHQPGRLLPTVISRCRQAAVSPPPREAALEWLRQAGVGSPEDVLAEAGGAPLTALCYADPERRSRLEAFLDELARPARMDPCALAQSQKDFLVESWGWLARWTYDLVALRSAGGNRYFRDRSSAIDQVARQADLVGLLDFQRELSEAARWLRHPLSAQLLLESWLIRYVQVTRGSHE